MPGGDRIAEVTLYDRCTARSMSEVLRLHYMRERRGAREQWRLPVRCMHCGGLLVSIVVVVMEITR